MLFQVRMNVRLPHAMAAAEAAELKKLEREKSQSLQASGQWRHLWRIAGQYSNVSIFDVASIDELHSILSALPLFPYMDMEVTALCRHPSAIRDDDR